MTRNQVSPAPSSDLPDAQPSRKEVPFVSGRLALLFLAFFAIMALFATQIYRLTVLQGPYYRSESENNFRTEVPIIAPRGKIYDRNRLPLAINERVFDVAMSPFNLTREEIETTVQRLAVLLNRPQLADRAEAVASLRPRWKSLTLVRDLQLDEVLPVQEQAFLLPGVIVQRSYRRIYPAGELAGNITGHVGMMSDRAEIAAFEARGYLRTEKIGRLNAEQSFETLLHGRNGLEEVFRDARGKPRSSPRIIEQAQPGQTLILTLDLGLQQLAHALLEGHNGVIIAMDPRDGAILAMAQRPNYDPNRPTQGYQVNKAYRGLYPPGSTFKIVTAAAGLKAGHLPTESVYCNGAIYLSRWRFPCHLRWGHGSETLYDALMHSCNVYFYTWARAGNIGFQGIVEAAESFGFGLPTGFDLAPPGRESGGRLATLGSNPLAGAVLHLSIGQGELIDVTPLQMARAYAALCNGGRLVRPYIIKDIQNPIGEPASALREIRDASEEPRVDLGEEHRKIIMEGLRRVVHQQGGTGARAGFKPKWRVAGKTGTAEPGGGAEPHAWFAGYAPYDDPEILVLVLVENAGHGGAVAGPLARQMFAAYFGEPEPEIVPAPPVEEAEQIASLTSTN